MKTAGVSFENFTNLAVGLSSSVDAGKRSFTVTRGNRAFTARHSQHKRTVTLTVECVTRPLPAVLLRTENATDRLGKRIGLNRELQTGDGIFDQNIYTESYAPDETLARLLSAENLRKGALFILQRGGFSQIELSKTGIKLKYVGSDASLIFDRERYEETLGALALLADSLPQFAEWETRTPWLTIGNLVTIGSIIVLVGGLIFTAICAGIYRPLDWSPWLTGWAVGAGAWILWIPVCGRLVRGRSDAMRHFLISTILFIFGLPILCGGAVVFANGFFDTSAAVPHQTHVTRQWTTRSKNSTNYHTEVQGWRPGDVGININGSAFYNSKKQGSPVTVISRAGALGYEWIEDYY